MTRSIKGSKHFLRCSAHDSCHARVLQNVRSIAVGALTINMLFLFATLAASTQLLPSLVWPIGIDYRYGCGREYYSVERIREELRLNKTARAAVDAGFDKAFSAILMPT